MYNTTMNSSEPFIDDIKWEDDICPVCHNLARVAIFQKDMEFANSPVKAGQRVFSCRFCLEKEMIIKTEKGVCQQCKRSCLILIEGTGKRVPFCGYCLWNKSSKRPHEQSRRTIQPF